MGEFGWKINLNDFFCFLFSFNSVKKSIIMERRAIMSEKTSECRENG